MASVGGVDCDFVRGGASQLKTRTERWEVPGLSGYGVLRLGLGDAPFDFELVRYDELATVNAWSVSIQALQSQVVTIIDDHGTTWASMLVETVSPIQRDAATGPGYDTRGTHRIAGVKLS